MLEVYQSLIRKFSSKIYIILTMLLFTTRFLYFSDIVVCIFLFDMCSRNQDEKITLTCVNNYLTFFLGDVSSKEKTSLLEFPVTPSTECSRVSSRSYVFTLDTDSLLITFANEAGEMIILFASQTSCVKFSDIANEIYVLKMCVFCPNNTFYKSICREENFSRYI